MNIVVCCKVVPDDQDIQIAGDCTLDYSKAKPIVSVYDLNAIEIASRIAADHEGSVVSVVTVGPKSIDDSKLKKNILARGADRLHMTADDALSSTDAKVTAYALADAIAEVGQVDLVLCGDGSADDYAQQVDVQLAEKLDVPVITSVAKLEVGDGTVTATRALEDCIEIVEVSLPAVLSVSPDVAEPRIPGMRDILAAGKKPMDVVGAAGTSETALDTVLCLAPDQVDRKQEVVDAVDADAIGKLAAAVKAAL